MLVQVGKISLGCLNLKKCRHSLITSIFVVQNNFIKNLLTAKSSECISDLFNGHASRPYNSTGMHLLLTNCKTTSSEADLPTLLNIAFTDR